MTLVPHTRLPAALAAGLLTVAGLATVAAAPPAVSDFVPSDAVTDCTAGGPRPCVLAFTRNGGPAGGFEYQARSFTLDGGRYVSLSVLKTGGDGFDLGAPALDDTFSATIDMGSAVPRVVTGKGRDAEVARNRATHVVTVTARPVVVSGQCKQSVYPWVCPEASVPTSTDFNNVEWDAYLDFQVTDYGSYGDAGLRDDLYGLDYFTNVAATSVPPEVVQDPATDAYLLKIDLANRRFRDDGTTLVQGRAELRVPHAFLHSAYGVPDPSLMTGASLAVTGGGAAATSSLTQDGGAVVVVLDGVTFPDVGGAGGPFTRGTGPSSMRTVRVRRGTVTPTRPHVTAARRTTPARARVAFAGARPRGARVTGYAVRCTGPQTVRAKGPGPAVVVRGLQRGRAYRCQVRALSKAGPSAWSQARRVARRP